MSETHVVLVGTTKVLSRNLKRALPETAQLEVVDTMERAMAVLAERPVSLMVLGPTLRRALAVVTTIRRDAGLKELGLIVVYRDDQREDVKRHLKGRFQADRYLMQSRINQDLRPAAEQLLAELAGDDDGSARRAAIGADETDIDIDADVEEIGSEQVTTEEVATVLMDLDKMRARMVGDSETAEGDRADVLEPLEDIGDLELLEDLEDEPGELEELEEELDDLEELETLDAAAGLEELDELDDDGELEALEPIDVITDTGIKDISADELREDEGIKALGSDAIEEIGADAIEEIGADAIEEIGADAITEIGTDAITEIGSNEMIDLNGCTTASGEMELAEIDLTDIVEVTGDTMVEESGRESDAESAALPDATDEVLEELSSDLVEELGAELVEDVTTEAFEEIEVTLAATVAASEAPAASDAGAAAADDTLREVATFGGAAAAPVGKAASHRHQPSGSEMLRSDLDELTGIIGRLQEAQSLIQLREAENEELRGRIAELESKPGERGSSSALAHELAEANAAVVAAEAMRDGLHGQLEEARATVEEVGAERDAAHAALEKLRASNTETARALFELASRLEG